LQTRVVVFKLRFDAPMHKLEFGANIGVWLF